VEKKGSPQYQLNLMMGRDIYTLMMPSNTIY